MDAAARKHYNDNFTADKYDKLVAHLNADLVDPLAFRVAETPVFLTDDFKNKLLKAGDEIIDTIMQPGFKNLTERAIPEKWRVPNENDHPHFITLDFGVCADEQGDIVPKLIELQGFPSLYGFQVHLADNFREVFDISNSWSVYFSGLNKESYLQLLRETILGSCKPDEVVLMDVDAPAQKTAADFYLTQKYLGIPVVSLGDLVIEGDQLFYKVNEEKKLVRRVYNRLIFDEIAGDEEIFNTVADVRQPLDVTWVTHPNWFYRISKFTMPFLKGDSIPYTRFLHQVDPVPADLENYVLKPLFSFAGQGVIIDVTDDDIKKINDPENWILQQKVAYVPVVQAPDGGVKVEIRLLYLWPDGYAKPVLAINLARLSRGKMIGVRYNKDFDWVGGTIAFMQQ